MIFKRIAHAQSFGDAYAIRQLLEKCDIEVTLVTPPASAVHSRQNRGFYIEVLRRQADIATRLLRETTLAVHLIDVEETGSILLATGSQDGQFEEQHHYRLASV